MNRITLSKWVLACAIVIVFVALPATAAEIWVAPADKSDHEVGDWGVTNNGEARFTFAIPDDLVELTSAQVVLLGKKDRNLSYDVALSISQDGLAQDTITASAEGLPASL